MKKTVLNVMAAVLCGLAAAGSALAADGFTADRHAAAGMKCETCHKSGTPQPGARVKKDVCKGCHDPAELAKKTEKLSPNPHYNHLGDVSCTDCHRGHQPSRLMCNDCHQFDLKVK